MCLRNDWYVPSWKSGVFNLVYVSHIRKGNLYCPTFSELKKRPCPDHPCKQELTRQVIRAVAKAGKNPIFFDFDEFTKPAPDIKWLLDVLSTLEPNHLFFKKDYMPPKRSKDAKPHEKLDNTDKFFSGLPEYS